MEKISFTETMQYHKRMFVFAKKETFKNLFGDIQNLFGDFVIAILSGIASMFWSYYKRGAMIDWIGVFVSAVAGIVGWSIILLVYNVFIKIPARAYTKERKRALYFSWEDVEFKCFAFSKKTGMGIGIEVISHKESGIGISHDCVTINRITKNMESVSLPRQDQRPIYLYLVGGNLGVFNYCGLIDNPKYNKNNIYDNYVIPVANWNEKEAWIVSENGKDSCGIDLQIGVTCQISIVIKNARENGDDTMRECNLICNLLYDLDEKDDQRKVLLDIVKRYPDYE